MPRKCRTLQTLTNRQAGRDFEPAPEQVWRYPAIQDFTKLLTGEYANLGRQRYDWILETASLTPKRAARGAPGARP